MNKVRMRILLAEDNHVNQLVVKHMLDPNAFELDITVNGVDAVEHFETNGPFDLVLMDVSMPEMDGYEATGAIRAIEAQKDISRTPIICLSAHILGADKTRSLEAGMDDFLAKPINQDQLFAVLDRWAERSSGTSAQSA